MGSALDRIVEELEALEERPWEAAERYSRKARVRWALADGRTAGALYAGWGVSLLGASAAIWVDRFELTPSLRSAVFASGVLVAIAGAVGSWLGYRHQAERTYERIWVRMHQLPFAVKGYFAVLAEDPSNAKTVDVAVTFVSEPPAREALNSRLAVIGGQLVGLEKATAEVRVQVDCPGDEPTNRNVHRWLSRLLAEVLIPMHAQAPIQEVRIS